MANETTAMYEDSCEEVRTPVHADRTILNRLTSGLKSAVGQDKMPVSTEKVMSGDERN